MVFCVSVQLAMVGWSDEAFHHLRLLMHRHCDHGRGALHPPGYRLWKSLKGGVHRAGGMGADFRGWARWDPRGS